MFWFRSAGNVRARGDYLMRFHRFETVAVFLQEPVVSTLHHRVAVKIPSEATAYFHDPLRMRIGKGPQQNALDDCEDCDGRSNGESEREHGHGREAGILRQQAKRVSQVLPKH